MTATAHADKPATRGWFHRHLIENRLLLLLVLGAMLLLALAMWLRAELAASRAENRSERERAALVARAAKALETQARESLQLGASALAWAVAEPLANGDEAALSRQLAALVKLSPVRALAVANAENVVVSATNRKWEGNPLFLALPGIATPPDELQIRREEGDFLASAPVVDREGGKLGTVLIFYRAADPAQKGAAQPGPTLAW